MARPGAYKSEKRKKELARQKKQEEKRQKRLNKGAATRHEAGDPAADKVEERAGVEEV